ncbi:hypothetical protein OE749_13640 [Aestuariibacter sp. AA17]|uniref:Uncharacterized protein n=1 Tax=Fluctibacter corallii TaxID=2984329 RepID=A0ABT3ABT0_9ALTE|nr:hypothetical protein [Aestuariibacter sp. AA17]MCV2885736.1 hypothetical protein [Aestuariibacter sp. AA17]
MCNRETLVLKISRKVIDEIHRTGMDTKSFMMKAIGDELFIRNELAEGNVLCSVSKYSTVKQLDMR